MKKADSVYIPKHFCISDLAEMQRFLAAHPLAVLITQAAGGLPQAAHAPCVWEQDGSEYGSLIGYLYLKNPSITGSSALAIFQNTGCYVSPSWYSEKAETHRAVPTWNDQALHLSGNISWIRDPAEIRAIVRRQSEVYEQQEASPWQLDDAPEDYLAQMTRAFTGFRLQITQAECRYKLSQNKSEAAQAGIIPALQARSEPACQQMASLIAAYSPHG